MKTVAALLLACATPAYAIVTRHDREGSRYLELGSRHPAVCRIAGRMGDGTLIAPRWVLTAAHVADGLRDRAEVSVRCGEKVHVIEAIFVHPEWSPFDPHDVALLRLATPVSGIEPLPLYAADDEGGRIATLVGHGATGHGTERARVEDGRRRGATSQVDRADENSLFFSFDPPPSGTDVEGAPGPGDSGGPALLEVEGQFFVAGVSSAASSGDAGPGSYGSVDVFARVSRHAGWIDTTMKTSVTATPPARGQGPAMSLADLPDTPASHRLAELWRLLKDGDAEQARAFVESAFVPSARTPEQRLAALERLKAEFAEAAPERVERSTPHLIDVRFSGGEEPLILGVECEPEPPHRIKAIMVGTP